MIASVGDDVKCVIECIESVCTVLAIIVGSIWTYLIFIKKREGKPRAIISHSVLFRQLTNGKIWLRVSMKIQNEGNVLIKWNDGLIRIQQVLPCDNERLEWIESRISESNRVQLEADWPMISEFSLLKSLREIEPNETDEIHYDEFLDSGVRTILVYSYILNSTKNSIGWNTLTVHDVPLY